MLYLSKDYGNPNNMDMDISCPHWIEDEFKFINFGDFRLIKRFKTIIKQLMANAQKNISSAFQDWSSIKGCYRFLGNEKTETNLILNEHIDRTVERINSHKGTILILHDTTYFDYRNRLKTSDLDRVAKGKRGENGSSGLILHNSLAITDTGNPLGLLRQKFVKREKINPKPRKKKRGLVHKLPVEKKESYRWIESIKKIQELNFTQNNIIHITDREGDFYELYKECMQHNAQFIIRASHNRSINKKKRREPPKDKMFDYFESLPVKGKVNTEIQVNKDKKHRKAELFISFGQYTLPAPPDRTINKNGNQLPHLPLSGVLIQERNPPVNEEALKWLLVTNLPIKTLSEAIEKMKWYIQRWNVELFHKILKSGCAVESAQLRTRNRLIKYITIKSIIAWRIFWLSRSFKNNEELDCNMILTKLEQTILFKRFNNGKEPKKVISSSKAYIWIAKLGGYIGRKSDPPPGMISIWRGWSRLMELVEDYKVICG